MMIGMIEGCTRILGKSQGYLGLSIKDQTYLDVTTGETVPTMVSAWLPSPAELEALNKGASIHVRLFGNQHPPIMLSVGTPPEEIDTNSSGDA